MSDVMKSAEEQLVEVLEIISEQSKLNPSGKAFAISTDCFSSCPNYKPILEKLDQESKVIRVIQRPDERLLSKPDHSMFEDEQPAEYADYMSYHIALLPTFTKFYEQQYKSSVLGLDKLSGLAFLKVYDVMLDIDEALSMSASDTVDIPIMRLVLRWTILCPADSPKYRDDYSDARWKAAKFLMDIGVLSLARVPSAQGWDSKIVITVKSRRDFQKALARMTELYKAQKPTANSESTKKQAKASSQTKENQKITFDTQTGVIAYGLQKVKLPDSSLEVFLFTNLYKANGKKITSQKLTDLYTQKYKVDEVTERALKDARVRINRKIGDEFGIFELVQYEKERFWLTNRYNL